MRNEEELRIRRGITLAYLKRGSAVIVLVRRRISNKTRDQKNHAYPHRRVKNNPPLPTFLLQVARLRVVEVAPSTFILHFPLRRALLFFPLFSSTFPLFYPKFSFIDPISVFLLFQVRRHCGLRYVPHFFPLHFTSLLLYDFITHQHLSYAHTRAHLQHSYCK
jgi:hypothetical protein